MPANDTLAMKVATNIDGDTTGSKLLRPVKDTSTVHSKFNKHRKGVSKQKKPP